MVKLNLLPQRDSRKVTPVGEEELTTSFIFKILNSISIHAVQIQFFNAII